jgi:hypothetical protein
VEDTQPDGGEGYCPPLVNDAGTIFYHKLGDNVSAFTDDGTQLTQLWVTPIDGYAPFSQMALGADGTLYAPSSGRVIRLDPATGEVLDSSPVIAQNAELFQMRPSAPANNIIYVTDGTSGVHVFTPDLAPLWFDPVPNLNISGVSIAPNGLVVVSGAGIIKAYKPTETATTMDEAGSDAPRLHPNPVSDQLVVRVHEGSPRDHYVLCDASGRIVRQGRMTSAQATIPMADLHAGVYLLRFGSSTVRVVKE